MGIHSNNKVACSTQDQTNIPVDKVEFALQYKLEQYGVINLEHLVVSHKGSIHLYKGNKQ